MRRIEILQNAGASSFWDANEGRYVDWSEMLQLEKLNAQVDTFKVKPNGFELILSFFEETDDEG